MVMKTLFFVSLAMLAGCNATESDQSIDRENSHLRWLVRLYVNAGLQGRGPKNEREFKSAIGGMEASLRDRALDGAKVQAIDELFISERDGLPYVIFYGKRPAGVDDGVVAYEQQGVEGVRYVGYALGMVEEADQARFEALIPAAARSQK